jgi:hypothetical protein
LTLFLIACAFACFAQTFSKNQIVIPLNNSTGVPFYKDPQLDDLVIFGFDIDEGGRFYFLGGDKTQWLTVFKGTTQLYRINKMLPSEPILSIASLWIG